MESDWILIISSSLTLPWAKWQCFHQSILLAILNREYPGWWMFQISWWCLDGQLTDHRIHFASQSTVSSAHRSCFQISCHHRPKFIQRKYTKQKEFSVIKNCQPHHHHCRQSVATVMMMNPNWKNLLEHLKKPWDWQHSDNKINILACDFCHVTKSTVLWNPVLINRTSVPLSSVLLFLHSDWSLKQTLPRWPLDFGYSDFDSR